MKSGTFIRTGSYSKDLTEATAEELETWLRTLHKEGLVQIVKVLVSTLKEIPKFDTREDKERA